MKPDLTCAPLNSVVAEFISKVVTREDLALYARASGDRNPLHLDRAAAERAGFKDVIVHGMLGMALLGRLLSKHFAPESIGSFNTRFASIIPVDNALHCRAHLIERDHVSATLALEARIANTEVIAMHGIAVISLFAG